MGTSKAKKDKTSGSIPPPANEDTGSTAEVSADTPSQVSTEKLGLRVLFAAYEEADAALTRAKSEFDLAAHERSRAVKAIYESSSPPSKGPFRYKGSIVTIVARTTKGVGDAPESVTYFFKGQRQDVLDVD